VLLADLKETIHAFTGLQAAGEPATERGPPPLVSEASSKEEILAQFRLEVAGWLCVAVGHRVIVSPIVERLTHFIDENYAERLTLDVLAAVVGRSKRHLATLFRQQTGQTVHRYLTQVRVHHAAALIRQQEKIEAVSLLVGYRGKKNFYQHFKQQLGVTPGAYKAALMGLAPPSGGEAAERVDP
jgi:AraC-like DNA-binding protein